MCFKNLPIQFDETGKAHLREGVTNPYAVTPTPGRGYVRRRGPSWLHPLGSGSGRSTR